MGNGPNASSVEAIEKVAAISDTVDPSPWVICHLKFKVCIPGNNFGGGGGDDWQLESRIGLQTVGIFLDLTRPNRINILWNL